MTLKAFHVWVQYKIIKLVEEAKLWAKGACPKFPLGGELEHS